VIDGLKEAFDEKIVENGRKTAKNERSVGWLKAQRILNESCLHSSAI
jgi:hypothetical protein